MAGNIRRVAPHQLVLLGCLYDGVALPDLCQSHTDSAGVRLCLQAAAGRGLLRSDLATLTDDGRRTVEHRRGIRPKKILEADADAPWQRAIKAQRDRAAKRREADERHEAAIQAEVARLLAGGEPKRCHLHGKLSWPTPEIAHIARVESLRTGAYDPGLVVYRCDRGEWWHLGHEGGWKSLQRLMEVV